MRKEDQFIAGRGRRKACTTSPSFLLLPASARWTASPSRIVTKTVGMAGCGWTLGSAPMVIYTSHAQHTCRGLGGDHVWWVDGVKVMKGCAQAEARLHASPGHAPSTPTHRHIHCTQ